MSQAETNRPRGTQEGEGGVPPQKKSSVFTVNLDCSPNISCDGLLGKILTVCVRARVCACLRM